jgi:hypothetical protein
MRKIMFAVGLLLLLPLSAVFAQGGGSSKAMSPVGAWDFTLDVDSDPPFQRVLIVYNFGGTLTATAASIPFLSSYGSWEKKGDRVTARHYTILPDENTLEHIGYLKVLLDYRLVDKDTLEGRSEVWFLLGTDPFNPVDAFFFGAGEDVGRRLSAEGSP